MRGEYSFRGTRNGKAHAFTIDSDAPFFISECSRPLMFYGDPDENAPRCKTCEREVARWPDSVEVPWRSDWDIYARAVDRAEREARERVRELFYGPRRQPEWVVERREAEKAERDAKWKRDMAEIDAMTRGMRLRTDRLMLQRGEIPDEVDRKRAAENSPDALDAYEAENEAMAAKIRRKRITAV